MIRVIAVVVLAIGLSPLCQAVSASDLSGLVGYTVVASTNASGELEGADYDKIVKLDNGMVFEFQTYDYFYAYRPDVIVFSKSVSLASGKPFADYKLIIEDEAEVFDVVRVR
jgi:hypothetical protein